MAIPHFQSLMTPILQAISDGQEHRLTDVLERLADEFALTPEERKTLQPSGKQYVFENRLRWATTYLFKAMLLERTGKGVIRIANRGRAALQDQTERVDNNFLKRFPEFVAFLQPPKKTDNGTNIKEDQDTPEDILESSYQDLRRSLAQEILDKVKSCSPRFFEVLVVDLLVAMGYGGSRKDAGEALGGTGDGGIDGMIKEDKLGLDIVYVQAKRWEATVGRPTVQAFAGSLDGQRARKGVMLTTSQFSPEAKDYVSKIEKKIVLIDGEELAQMMIDHDIGVTEIVRYAVKKMDLDYFEEE